MEAHPHVVGDILGFPEHSHSETVKPDVTIATRHIRLVILLAVLVSHAGVAVHATTHVSGDSSKCEYCVAYGDSIFATDTVHKQAVPELTPEHVSAILTVPTASRQALPFRPRDPPLAD